jgi:hypothetical protein
MNIPSTHVSPISQETGLQTQPEIRQKALTLSDKISNLYNSNLMFAASYVVAFKLAAHFEKESPLQANFLKGMYNILLINKVLEGLSARNHTTIVNRVNCP